MAFDRAGEFGLLSLLIATSPVQDINVWAQWGLAGLVVGYTLWRDYHRERRMADSLDRDHVWMRETMLLALTQSTRALEETTAVMRRVDSHLEQRK